jgi:hypothetical protein
MPLPLDPASREMGGAMIIHAQGNNVGSWSQPLSDSATTWMRLEVLADIRLEKALHTAELAPSHSALEDLGPVDVHREAMMAAARLMLARKLVSVLS